MNDKHILTRRDFLRLMLSAGGAVLLGPALKACAPASGTPTPALATGLLDGLDGLGIDAFFEEAFRRWIVRDPESLTSIGLADFYGVGDSDLTDISDGYIRDTQALEAGTLDLLRAYDRSAFTDPQALTAEIYDWFLDDLVRGHAFLYADYPLNPILTSVHKNLYFLLTIYHPLNNLQDAEDYLSRLGQVGRKLDQLIDNLNRRQEFGILLPAFMIPIVQGDLDPLGSGPARDHDFYTSFANRLTGVEAAKKSSLLSRVEAEIEATVIPAYQELSGALTDLQPEAPTRIGVWQFPDGEAVYAQALRHHTTTDTDAEQVEALGVEHLERIHTQMRLLFSALGYPDGESIASLYNRLTRDSGVYRGQEAVEAYEQAIREAEELIPAAFDLFPRAAVLVVGGTEGDYYTSPPYDGSRPGIFYARTDSATPRFGVKTLAYHETIPGHHTQIAIAQELPDQPSLRKGVQFNAYVEGWALYAERLMWELGAYQDDLPGDLGRLQAEAFRAARLVVDTGIHARRWSFDRAVEFLSEATGFPVGNAQREIVRYAVWPGQATSYYLGFLTLLDLRQRSMEALGAGFDLAAFHRLVLGSGALPLTILAQQVERFIEASR